MPSEMMEIHDSFSVLHTMGYSTIALQEMNLAYKFPIIYWNTACLSVNADAVSEEDYEALIEDEIIEIDEEDLKGGSSKVQYGKVAAAISKFREELGVEIALPDINKAKFGFTPDPFKNQILFGLKGLSRIGDNLIRTIIDNRPYDSLHHFLEKLNGNGKTVVSKDRVVILIKSGAFDQLLGRPRREIMKDFISTIADQKKRITLQNMNMLINYNLVPDYLAEEIAIYNYTKYLRGNRIGQTHYRLDDIALDFYYENAFSEDQLEIKVENGENYGVISVGYWDGIYNTYMNNVRQWMASEQEEILAALNSVLLEEEVEKYSSGSILDWELDSLGFYHSGHPLDGVAETFPDGVVVSKLTDVGEMERDGFFTIKGKLIPKYNIKHIIGTVIDKNKTRRTVTLATPEGTISIKLFQSQFAHYDKINSSYNDYGEKIVSQDTFFRKGTFLFVSGVKNGDSFLPKVYKSHGIDPILKFYLTEDGEYDRVESKV